MPQDDAPLFIVRRDLSNGCNSRQHEQVVGEQEATVLKNVSLDTQGQRELRTGATLLESVATSAGTGCFGFNPDGGNPKLLISEATNIWYASAFTSSGFVTAKTDFTTNLSTTFVKALESDEADVVIMANGTDNAFRINQSQTMADLGDANTSPPKTTVLEWFRNRLWALKSNKLYYSGAIPSDFSNTFDRTNNYYYIPTGTERRIIGVRDTGMLIAGSDQIWGLNPTITPAPATDKPELILDMGCIAGNSMQMVADDVWFLADDGIRGVFRTQQDKLQLGQSKPLSWKLKTEFEDLNLAHITKADAVYYKGKYIIALPTGSSTYNNTVWVAYPDIKDAYGLPSWVVYSGWNIAKFATLTVNGESRLYGIDSTNAKVYRLFYGKSDNNTAIAFTEESRAEDFGQPLKRKWGGEFKIKARGGSGTLVVSASIDGDSYSQLGSVSLALGGVTFPTTFPVLFSSEDEVTEQWHLDSLGEFKRIKFKLYCDTLDASVKILETIAVTFVNEYMSED